MNFLNFPTLSLLLFRSKYFPHFFLFSDTLSLYYFPWKTGPDVGVLISVFYATTVPMSARTRVMPCPLLLLPESNALSGDSSIQLRPRTLSKLSLLRFRMKQKCQGHTLPALLIIDFYLAFYKLTSNSSFITPFTSVLLMIAVSVIFIIIIICTIKPSF
jgi:hypothetical protein